jgi:hypothetical protein
MTTVHELRAPDDRLIAWLEERPSYCDRGRYRAGFEVVFPVSDVDWGGERYYFVLEAAKVEVELYLRAKEIDITGTTWSEQLYQNGERVPPRVHILLHGRAVCFFSSSLPGNWPTDHRWVHADEAMNASCRECVERLSTIFDCERQ